MSEHELIYKDSRSTPIVEILWWNETQNCDQKNHNKPWNESVAKVRRWLNNSQWKEIWESQRAIMVVGELKL